MNRKHAYHPSVLLSLVLVMLVSLSSGQQVLFNSGAAIYIQANENIYVQGGVTNTNSGTFVNSGTVNVAGDWINDAGNAAFNPTNTGTVVLTGGNQTIGGSSLTNFNNLTLAGTGIKSLGINSAFEGILALADRELATHTFVMTCNSSNTAAITRTTGFVSSEMNGNLSRKTASTGTYLFPVGTSQNVTRYRPVTLTPTINSANTFAVALIAGNPGLEGFDVLDFTSPICVVNPNYFYTIDRSSGIAPVDMSIFFDDVADGDYSIISQWLSASWQSAGAATLTANVSPTLSSLNMSAFNSFSSPYFDIAAPAVNGLQLITQSNDTLYAGPALTYQWYFNGGIITGATNSWYVPTQQGSYTVTVTTSGNCTMTSAPYNYIIGGISAEQQPGLTIFPNPFTGEISVRGYSVSDKTQISLKDVFGRSLYHPVTIGKGEFIVSIRTTDYASGLYFLTIENGNSRESHKLIKL